MKQCIICECELEDIMPGVDEKKHSSYIAGGNFDIDFGFGSRFDDMNFDNTIRHEAYICDDCFGARQHLTKPVQINWCMVREDLPRNYRGETENEGD